MSEHPAKRGSHPACSNKLYLMFHIGEERYALEAMEIAEILPRLQLKSVARAPHWVAGILAYRGAMVPVIDLCALTFGQPAKVRTSTRLVLVNYRVDTAAPQLLGLILEQATDTLRCSPREFKAYGLDNPDARYLGPVREDESGLLQLIHVQDLLSDEVRALLYPQPPAVIEEAQ
jgi:chemotaxis-related protein WspB